MNKSAKATVVHKQIKNNHLFKGTLILTLAGFITRIIGFFYKIFLSNTMGTEMLGIYQLVFPVYGICFTIYATGIQSAISRLVAGEKGRRNPKNIYKILITGSIVSIGLACLLSFLVYYYSDYIAYRFILEPRSAQSFKVLAFAFPFCALTSCINGYYYGLKKTEIPATTQLIEQIARVIIVYIVAFISSKGDLIVTCELAVFGIVFGEFISSIYNFLSLFFSREPIKLIHSGADPNAKPASRRRITKNLLSLSIPLSANRFFINILLSMETVLIPTMLKRFGLSNSQALSTLGVLNGMALPFIMFPSAIINALAVLLLPTISEAQAINNEKLLGKTSALSIKYSLIVGIMSTGIFVFFGEDLGMSIFANKEAATYITILAWICPLIYLTTTLASIINGLGKAHITFFNSIAGVMTKIFFIIVLIPRIGIRGYLISLLIGQLIITVLDTIAVIRNIPFYFDAVNSLLKPGVIVAFNGFIVKNIYILTKKITQINEALLVLSFCLLFCVICMFLFFICKIIRKSDFS